MHKKNSEKPKVSVITVCFNLIKNGRGKTFVRALESVAEQSYENIEHIIIDGASTDSTSELLGECSSRFNIKVLSEPDKGIYDAMNKGIRLSEGKYIIFLNSDDFFHEKNGIENAVKLLEDSRADFSYSGIRVSYDDETRYEIHPAKIYNIFTSVPFCHQAMAVRKDVFIKYGFFDESLKMSADYDFMLRIVLAGCAGVYCPLVYATFRGGGDERTTSTIERDTLSIMLKNYAPMLGDNPGRYASDFWNYSFPARLYAPVFRRLHPSVRGGFWRFLFRQLVRELFISRTRPRRRTLRILGVNLVKSNPPQI